MLGGLLALEARLQSGINTIASKANEFIGISNYHISDFFFTASGLVLASPGLINLFSEKPDISRDIVSIGVGLSYSAYQMYRNNKLESLEQKSSSQQGEALAIELNLKEEKRGLVSRSSLLPTGKFVYAGWVFYDVAVQYFPANIFFTQFVLSPIIFSAHLALLAAQYFREAEYTSPTAKKQGI